MDINPVKEFIEEALDLEDPATYALDSSCNREQPVLTSSIGLSKAFAELEDEKIWSRRWVAVGFDSDIPKPGDLLPFTVGNHGVHVERLQQGGLVGRFNKAQHGGCRFIPQQCQNGAKTRCSYTSCGYSRDEGALRYDQLDDPHRRLGQYLGDRPEKLLPVRVKTVEGLILVNIDPRQSMEHYSSGLTEAIALQDSLSELTASAIQDVVVQANWKVLLLAWLQEAETYGEPIHATTLALEDGSPTLIADGANRQRQPSAGKPSRLLVYPNLLVEQTESGTAASILQPVGTDMCRIVRYQSNEHAPLTDALDTTWVQTAQTALPELFSGGEPNLGTTMGFGTTASTYTGLAVTRRLISDVLKQYTDEEIHPIFFHRSFTSRRN